MHTRRVRTTFRECPSLLERSRSSDFESDDSERDPSLCAVCKSCFSGEPQSEIGLTILNDIE